MLVMAVALLVSSCKGVRENQKAKDMMQGQWVNADTGEDVFTVKGDTIYFPETANAPLHFRIVDDSLQTERDSASCANYAIIRQGDNIFWMKNINGELLKLHRKELGDIEVNDTLSADSVALTINSYCGQRNTESSATVGGKVYTFRKEIHRSNDVIIRTELNPDGMEMANLYYDNTIHLSLSRDGKMVFDHDFSRDQFTDNMQQPFASRAVLYDVLCTGVDARGWCLDVVFRIPSSHLSYTVSIMVTGDGELKI